MEKRRLWNEYRRAWRQKAPRVYYACVICTAFCLVCLLAALGALLGKSSALATALFAVFIVLAVMATVLATPYLEGWRKYRNQNRK